jgi:hypothetical protein
MYNAISLHYEKIQFVAGAARNVLSLPGDPTAVTVTRLCIIFDDPVTDRLCSLRKHELVGKGTFSCAGCSSKQGSRLKRTGQGPE